MTSAAVVPGERRPAGEHLVQHHAERKEVGARVGFLAAGLLGGHVAHRAHHQSLSRLEDVRRPTDQGSRELGEAEVEHLHVAVVAHHHVLGLEVAVHDAGGVRGDQCLRHLGGDVERPARLETAARRSVRSVTPSMNSVAMKRRPRAWPVS